MTKDDRVVKSRRDFRLRIKDKGDGPFSGDIKFKNLNLNLISRIPLIMKSFYDY